MLKCIPQLSDTNHLEYAALFWDPHLQVNIPLLESVQKFALKICTEHWNVGYSALLDMVHVPSLENRRIYLKLYTFF